MNKYLASTVEKLKARHFSSIIFILGNETCDLDSATCALAYGSFLHWQFKNIKVKKVMLAKSKSASDLQFTTDNAAFADDIFVPILNVDREDYELKTEVEFCLRSHNITPDMLVFRDDVDLKYLTTKYKASVVLVDHHVLARNDSFLTPLVIDVLDHRPQADDWPFSDETKYTIQQVGSCSTLVTQRVKNLSTLVAKETDFFAADVTAADLLHCSIILDTVNFSPTVNKSTPLDVETVAFLETILRPSDAEEFRKKRLKCLVEARKNVTHLSAPKLLRKDVKIIKDILVPSFPLLVEEFLRKPESLEAVSDALCIRECAMAVLLGMRLGGRGELRRDVAVVEERRTERGAQLAKFLQEWSDPPLQLVPFEPLSAPLPPNCIYFKQINLSASRKQYIPAVCAFVNKDRLPPYVPSTPPPSEIFQDFKKPDLPLKVWK